MKFLVYESGEWKVPFNRSFAFVIVGLLVVGIYGSALKPVNGIQEPVFPKENQAPTGRMLLTSTTEDYGDGNSTSDGSSGDGGSNDVGDGSSNRIGIGATCSKDNILVYQDATPPLPNGIPTYTVEVQNLCVSGSCSISDIHLSCEWFSSACLVDPKIFRRVGYNDCLVNDGEPLNPGESLSFQYANTFKYPLSVSSVAC